MSAAINYAAAHRQAVNPARLAQIEHYRAVRQRMLDAARAREERKEAARLEAERQKAEAEAAELLRKIELAAEEQRRKEEAHSLVRKGQDASQAVTQYPQISRSRFLHYAGIIERTYEVTLEQIMGNGRQRPLPSARAHLAALLARDCGASSTEIGNKLNKDHTTILYYIACYNRAFSTAARETGMQVDKKFRVSLQFRQIGDPDPPALLHLMEGK